MSRVGLVLMLLAIVLTAVSSARAEMQPVRLAWVRGEGADDCPDGAEMVARVEERLGPEAIDPEAALTVEGVVDAQPAYQVRLRVRDEEGRVVGQRVLDSEASTCETIAEAATLAIALTIDPTASLAPTSAERGGAEAAEEETTSVPEETPEPAECQPRVVPMAVPAYAGQASCPPAPPPVRDVARLAAHAIGAAGLLPRVAAGVQITGRVEVFERVWLGLGMAWLPEVDHRDQFAFGSTWGTVTGCYDVLPFSRGGLMACGHLHAGAIHGLLHDRDTLEPIDPGQEPWLGAGLSPELRLHLPWKLHAELGVEGLVSVLNNRFVFEGTGEEIYAQPVGAVVGYGGLGVAFP